MAGFGKVRNEKGRRLRSSSINKAPLSKAVQSLTGSYRSKKFEPKRDRPSVILRHQKGARGCGSSCLKGGEVRSTSVLKRVPWIAKVRAQKGTPRPERFGAKKETESGEVRH